LPKTKVYLLPFFLLRKLRVPRRQRWGLFGIFALGAFTIGTSIARTIALAGIPNVVQVKIWTLFEGGVGIIVACSPALKAFFKRHGERIKDTAPKGSQISLHSHLASTPDRHKQDISEADDMGDGKISVNESDIFPPVDQFVDKGQETMKPANFHNNMQESYELLTVEEERNRISMRQNS
jgi:hypothetical protein